MWRLSGFLALLSHNVLASIFLQRPAPEFPQDTFGQQGSDSNILEQLEEALGNDYRVATETRLQNIEEALRPIFAALPKGFSGGKVGPPAARYALHRLFIQRHGWQVKGLAANGETWSGNPASDALANKVPHHVKVLFDDRLGSTGLDLHELAVFSSMLEHLIHSESEDRLKAAYNFSSWDTTQVLSRKSATKVIETYMIIYLSGFNVTKVARARIKNFIDNVEKYYPSWKDTRPFLHRVQREVAHNLGAYSFDNIMAVVDQVGEQFGRFQNQECVDLKESLMKLEESNGSGRVRVGDFYSGQWHFSESVDYLRQLGALDESNKANLRVIIPNYLNAPSNCIASSAYYGVCCIDDCEELVGQLERKLRAYTASPAEVAAIVRMQLADLPSASGAGNRTLSKALLDKLQELAEHHGGRVPIHGRLFAQWLHLVYPRECPYPHVSGTIQPKTNKEWSASGQTVRAREEEKQQYIEVASRLKDVSRRQVAAENTTASEILCTAMWTMEEELVDEHAHHAEMQNLQRVHQERRLQSKVPFLLFTCSAAVAFALSLSRMLRVVAMVAVVAPKVADHSRLGVSSTSAVHTHLV